MPRKLVLPVPQPTAISAPASLTIKDVARRAKVSVGTVSRVINNAKNVDAELRARVTSAMGELGFSPDPAARTLRSRNSRVIGVVLPDIKNPLTSAAILGVEPVLSDAGYTMFLASSYADVRREKEIVDHFEKRRVDGIIAMVASDVDADTLVRMRGLTMPLVLLERDMDVAADSVRTDQFEGTYKATRYLLGLGHERIAMITVPGTTLSGRERCRGYRSAFEDYDVALAGDLLFTEGRDRPYALESAYAALTGLQPPTAIIVSGGMLAGTIEAVRLLNIRIPQQLSLITLGDTELAGLLEPPITAVRYDWASTGHYAASLLTRRLAGGDPIPHQRMIVSHEFVMRGSCAPPRTRSGRSNSDEPFH